MGKTAHTVTDQVSIQIDQSAKENVNAMHFFPSTNVTWMLVQRDETAVRANSPFGCYKSLQKKRAQQDDIITRAPVQLKTLCMYWFVFWSLIWYFVCRKKSLFLPHFVSFCFYRYTNLSTPAEHKNFFVIFWISLVFVCHFSLPARASLLHLALLALLKLCFQLHRDSHVFNRLNNNFTGFQQAALFLNNKNRFIHTFINHHYIEEILSPCCTHILHFFIWKKASMDLIKNIQKMLVMEAPHIFAMTLKLKKKTWFLLKLFSSSFWFTLQT